MRSELLARVLLAVICFSMVAMAEFATESTQRQLLYSVGSYGRLSLWLLGILAILSVTDVLVNEVLPNRFRLQWLKCFRQTKWMLTGLLCVSYAYVLVKTRLGVGLSLMFLIYGACSFVIAFKDASHSIRGRAYSAPNDLGKGDGIGNF